MEKLLETIEAYEHAITDNKRFDHETIEFFVSRLFQLNKKIEEVED